MQPRSFTFDDQMKMSEGATDTRNIGDIILVCFPNAVKVEKASSSDDKNGTDYWVTMISGARESVDVKVREKDFGQEDVALETWSKVNTRIGWTRDLKKRTDYILWLWKSSGRWMLVPFPMLCHVFCKRWETWREEYKTRKQHTNNPDGSRWQSECVFVPKKVVWNEIYRTFGGGKPSVPFIPRHKGGLPEGGYIQQMGPDDKAS
jgi:hypothetical protein